MIMDMALLENMARRETGRSAIPSKSWTPARLVIFPTTLEYRRLLREGTVDRSNKTYFLEYGGGHPNLLGSPIAYFHFLITLMKLLVVCSQVDFYVFSGKSNRLYILTTVIVARLLGISIDLHDYRFRMGRGARLSRIVYPLCRRLEAGDISAVSEVGAHISPTCYRSELIKPEPYRKLGKEKAIPRVLVYGDLEDKKIISLVKRTHELIKQKYPRTEFILISFNSTTDGYPLTDVCDNSIRVAVPESEEMLVSLLDESDMVMLLSPGGINRCLLVRARAAGYPIIVNGIDYPPEMSKIITAPRGSYSGLADAVIRLVDDETYYISFSEGPHSELS